MSYAASCAEQILRTVGLLAHKHAARPAPLSPNTVLQVVETYPYEQLSHAVVAWMDENLDRCDIVHTHEWGGVFSDLSTLANLRQLKPGELQCHV